MKIILFLALTILASNAFNLTAYESGFDDGLQFTPTQAQDETTCLNAIIADISQIYQLLQSEDLDSILENLGNQIIQIQTDLQTTCQPFTSDFLSYIAQNANITDLNQIIEESFTKYYPIIISDVGSFAESLESNNDYGAGYDQSIILNILLGLYNYNVVTPQVNINQTVPFNASAFLQEYTTEVFNMLGIKTKPRVAALVRCFDQIENFTITALYVKNKYYSLDFEQKLNAVEYLLGRGFNVIRKCEKAAEVEDLIFAPIVKAFEQDPVTFTLKVLENIAMNFATIKFQMETESVDIQEGEYMLAGGERAAMIMETFGELVNFRQIK